MRGHKGFQALASLQSLDPHQRGQRELSLVLASRSEYFWKSEQFHFILAINVLFRDLDLKLAAPGEILIYLLAAYVACRETKLEGCADTIKTIHFFFDDTASPPLRLELQLRAWESHYGMAALVLSVVIATRRHGQGHVSTHVRWLYKQKEFLTPPPCLMLSFWGPINKSRFANRRVAWNDK